MVPYMKINKYIAVLYLYNLERFNNLAKLLFHYKNIPRKAKYDREKFIATNL